MAEKASPKPKAPQGPARRARTMAVGGVVQAVLQKNGGQEIAALAALLPHWRTVVPSLHAHCWPIALQRGTLTLAVSSASVRQQLHYETPGILHMLALVLGQGRVTALRTTLGHPGSILTPQRTTSATLSQQKCPKNPINSEALAKAQSLCQSVRDFELQQALAGLGAYLITQKESR